MQKKLHKKNKRDKLGPSIGIAEVGADDLETNIADGDKGTDNLSLGTSISTANTNSSADNLD